MSTASLVSQRAASRLPVLLGISAFVVLLDRITKIWVSQHVELGGSHPVIPRIFSISHVQNEGAAFSLFASSPQPQLVRWLLIGFSILAALVVFGFLLKFGRQVTATTVALALILGGAIGNVYDRLVYGTVIDFLEVHLIFGRWNYHWPDFNVADSAIVCGGILLFVSAFFAGSEPAGEFKT